VSEYILAIDTAREYGSIAVARGEQILEEVLIHAPDGFAHVLYGELRRLLERTGVELSAIDCFAAASGPGSFTGVRISLACIKGLAEVMHKPATAVSNLQALAWFGTAPLRAVVSDARRGEVYAALYDGCGGLVGPEVVARLADWVEALPQLPIEFISQDFSAFDYAFPGRKVEAPQAVAGAIARVAWEKLQRGEAQDPAVLEANYVRRPDIRT
jgi:tRNA threonylcarbamoyladenosine biosynthesis protein TsaB